MKSIGVDLGTTNTVAAIGGQVFATHADGSILLPSVVAFPPTGVRLVGKRAHSRRPIDPRNTIFSSKRLIGRKWESADTQEFKKRYNFILEQDSDGEPSFKTRSGQFTATDIATLILEAVNQFALSAEALAKAGPDNIKTTITVPSMFRDAERQATREAALQAGITQVEIVDEPQATAEAYLQAAGEKVRLAAIYDFGGGTFDLAVVECSENQVNVLAHGGDLYLGGDDIDQGLAEWVAGEVLKQHRWDYHDDQEVYSRLVGECEKAKIRLCQQEETVVDLTQVDPAAPFASARVKINRNTLAKLAEQLVRKTFLLCDEVLRNANHKAQDLDALFVAGGATLLPMVKKDVEAYFGKPINYVHDPMHIVAIGASLMAARG